MCIYVYKHTHTHKHTLIQTKTDIEMQRMNRVQRTQLECLGSDPASASSYSCDLRARCLNSLGLSFFLYSVEIRQIYTP